MRCRVRLQPDALVGRVTELGSLGHFYAMSRIQGVIRELERVIKILRASRCGGEWAAEREQRLIGLRAVDGSQKQAVAALRGSCHQPALGDALTKDAANYMLQVTKLREASDRAITSY